MNVKDLRDVRAIEKLIHGFDLNEGSKEAWQPARVGLSVGRVGYERPWAYYVDLAERIYALLEDTIEDMQEKK